MCNEFDHWTLSLESETTELDTQDVTESGELSVECEFPFVFVPLLFPLFLFCLCLVSISPFILLSLSFASFICCLFVCLFVCLFLLCLYLYRALFTLAPVPAVESLLEDVDGAVTSLLLVVQRLSKATECENENREMQTEDPGCSSGKNNCVCVWVDSLCQPPLLPPGDHPPDHSSSDERHLKFEVRSFCSGPYEKV